MVTTNAQENIYIGAGATHSFTNEDVDLIDKTGYYISISTAKKLTDKSGYVGEVQFITDRAASLKNNSINGLFAFRYFLINRLSIHAGFQIGIYVYDNIGTEIKSISKGKMDFIAGITYSIKRFDITGRYNYKLNREYFNDICQIGASYRLKKQE